MTDNDDIAVEGDIVDVLREWVSPNGGYVTVASDLLANAAHEIEELRALITTWADAEWHVDIVTNGYLDRVDAYNDTCDSLRKAVGR